MNQDSLGLFVLLGLAILALGVLVFFLWLFGRRNPQGVEPPASPPVEDPVTPGALISAETRLEALPHFLRLQDQRLLDLHRGTLISYCSCKAYPFQHFMVQFPEIKIGLVSLRTLERFVAFEEGLGAQFQWRYAQQRPAPKP